MANGTFDPEKARADFLVAMYNQLMNDINRHIVVVWQSVSVLVGAFAVWSLVEKNVISLDIAVTLIILLSAWVIGHVYDAAYWYNRNLVMIANIERQFLRVSDLKEIHYYFGKHRKENVMLTHLRLQRSLALAIAALVLGIHYFSALEPHRGVCFVTAKAVNFLPLLAMASTLAVWWWRHHVSGQKYQEFLANSPGKQIDTAGIAYGVGHPTK